MLGILIGIVFSPVKWTLGREANRSCFQSEPKGPKKRKLGVFVDENGNVSSEYPSIEGGFGK